MSVSPNWTDRVSADMFQPHEFERSRGQGSIRAFVKIAQDIHLAGATRAWAGAAQTLDVYETLAAIVPFHSQLVPDVLYVCRTHPNRLVNRTRLAN